MRPIYPSSVAHPYKALLTLPDRSMPPMEVDAAYQGCLPCCELHSRSLAIGRTGACNLEIAHMWLVQSYGGPGAAAFRRSIRTYSWTVVAPHFVHTMSALLP